MNVVQKISSAMVFNEGRSNSESSGFENRMSKLIRGVGPGVFTEISEGWSIEVKSSGIEAKSGVEDLESILLESPINSDVIFL